MEPPRFYHYAKASGLVSAEILDDILRGWTDDGSSSTRKGPTALPTRRDSQRVDLEHLQHGACLRKRPFRSKIEPDPQAISGIISERLDDSDASLDGESDGNKAERITDMDRRLADELIRRGFLNHWQSVQLLDGRTKFTLGDYWVLDAIGKGGYGHVFLGREDRKSRKRQPGGPPEIFGAEQYVALKVLPLAKTTPELTRRFLHEIDIQKDLCHPNLVRFLESARDGNVHYMVHEFVDGGDLKHLLQREGRLPYDVAALIVSHLADALDYLHGRGIVHRDVKPANVLLSSDGFAKLIDMGLAVPFDRKALSFSSAMPEESAVLEKQIDKATHRTGKVAGTVDYMAPDQIRNSSEPSPAWDIYSLGCTFYQILTGTVPFPNGDAKQKFRAHLQVSATDPRVFDQSIPFDIVEVVRSMLAKDPGGRIRSAEEIVRRLAPWIPPSGFSGNIVFGNPPSREPEPLSMPFTRKTPNPRTVISIPRQ